MANWTVVVDPGVCIGCGTCAEIAPNSYRMKDDNIAEFSGFGDPEETIMEGAKSCPVDAITITDNATKAKLWPQ